LATFPRIVEAFDVIKDVSPCFSVSEVSSPIDTFSFEHTEEGLCG